MWRLSATALLTFGACDLAAGAATCFEDLAQHYEYDDGGYHWSLMPGLCPDEKNIPAAGRAMSGSVDIRVSGDRAAITETQVRWTPPPHSSATATSCPHSIKIVNTRTRVMTGGVVYETTQDGDSPLQNSQRPARPNEILYVSRIEGAARPSRLMNDLGRDTIAGYACTRVSPKTAVPGTGTHEFCVLSDAPECRKADYVLPLEFTMKGADGRVQWHGKTTSLQYGALGKIVTPDSIRAP